MSEETAGPQSWPEGQYAKVEMMGHRTVWGRITEIEKFGTPELAAAA